MARYSPKKKTKSPPKRNLLPLWLGLLGALLLGAAIWAMLRNSSPTTGGTGSGTPSLQVDQETIDYGNVPLGTTVRTEIKVTNSGEGTLRFSQKPYVEVAEGCWPPVPVIGSMALNPGESTTVRMEFMMHGDMGGKHDFRLHLVSNDPAQPDKEIKILSNWVE